MSAYAADIVELLGCSEQDANMVEYIMREEIFHSTLDWQSAAQFNRAARKAAKMLEEDRATYEEYFAVTRAAYERMHAETLAKAKGNSHEV